MTSSQLSEAPTATFNYIELMFSRVSKCSLLCSAVVVAVLLRWSLDGKRTLVRYLQIKRTLSSGCYYPPGGAA